MVFELISVMHSIVLMLMFFFIQLDDTLNARSKFLDMKKVESLEAELRKVKCLYVVYGVCVCVCVCMCVCVYVRACIFVPPVYLCFWLCLSIYLSFYLSNYLTVCLSICASIYQVIYLYVYLSCY